MCDRNLKLAITSSVIVLAMVHALAIVVGERAAPRIEQAIGLQPITASQSNVRSAAIDFDAAVGGVGFQSSTLPTNRSAQSEIKQQFQPCYPCQPQTTTPQPTVLRVTPVATNARESLSLFVGNDAQSQTILQWFNTDPQLQNLRSKVNFQTYTPSNALYQTRYKQTVPESAFPALVFSASDGGHIHAVFREMWPSTPAQLHADLKSAFELQKQVVSSRPAVNGPSAVDVPIQIQMQDVRPLLNLQDCDGGQCTPDRQPILPLFNRDRPGSESGTIVQSLLNRHGGESLVLLIAVCILGYLVFRRFEK